MRHPAVAVLPEAPDPEEVFGRISGLPHAVWLDATADAAGTGRWSYIAADPFAVLQARDGRTTWMTADGTRRLPGPASEELAAALARLRSDVPPPIPFDGGAAGFVGYEAAAEFERLPPAPPRDQALPDVHLAFFDVVIGWNHETGRCTVVSTGRPRTGEARERRARRRLAETLDWLAGRRPPRPAIAMPDAARRRVATPGTEAAPEFPVEGFPWLRSTATREAYVRAVERLIGAIRDGDVYQVNLSQRFSARTATNPSDIHRELRRRSPAPYGAFVRLGEASLVSSSPERFLRIDPDGRVEARPIKGTRPRHPDADADARLAATLLRSEKERAENLMIVDLIRNDLSRVCRPGTIRVPALFRLESWATVHHLVSVVRGRLREGVGVDDVLRATFPCGSVTGAPKIRAMELIARDERVARGPYCGAIGYFGFGGGVELSVAIRILVASGGRIGFHAGGGIVYDSDPEAEYRETLDKARAIIEAVQAAGGAGHDVPRAGCRSAGGVAAASPASGDTAAARCHDR